MKRGPMTPRPSHMVEGPFRYPKETLEGALERLRRHAWNALLPPLAACAALIARGLRRVA